MMGAWMVYAVVVGALLALAARIVEGLLRARARPCRWVWALSTTASLVLPVASLSRESSARDGGAPAEAVGAITGGLRLDAYAEVGAVRALLAAADPFLVPGWLAGSVLLAIVFGTGLLRLRSRARSWPAARIDGTEVRISDDFGPAVVWGSIVMPRWILRLDAERLSMAVWHEREHRAAGDPALLLAGAAAVLVAPWNPALWWQVGRLRAAMEIDCDARVLARGARRALYGSLLLEVGTAGGRMPAAVAALSTTPSLLERRLTMIGRRAKKQGKLVTGALSATAVLALIMACEAAPPTDPGDPLASIGGTEGVRPEAESGPAREVLELAGPGSPIVYVDGVRLRDADALQDVDPDAIERIEVIKGGAAERLFGAEAAGGVIQVFLKGEDGSERR